MGGPRLGAGRIRRLGIAHAIYTQTTDVEGEINGLTTYDRKVVKFDAARLSDFHRRLKALVAAR